MRIAESFAADTHHSVQLELLPASDPTDPGQVRVGAASERGSTLALVDAVIAGDPLTVAFNTKLLREALANLGHPHTLLRLRTPTMPAIVAPPETAGTDHLCLLMPLALASRPATPPAPPPAAQPAPPPAAAVPVAAAAA